MPYLFLKTIANISNFHVPTPIILSGDSMKECRGIKSKFMNTISNRKCSAYLLSVALADLLENLELEGFKTVKIQRNGSHNIWVLHRNVDKKTSSININKQVEQKNEEKSESGEKNGNLPLDNVSQKNILKPSQISWKCQQCQTVKEGLLGDGDHDDLCNAQSHCSKESSNLTTIAHKSNESKNQTKFCRHMQNQTSFNQINVTKTDFSCQFDTVDSRCIDIDHKNIEKNKEYSDVTTDQLKHNSFINVTNEDAIKTSHDITDFNKEYSGFKTSEKDSSMLDYNEHKEYCNSKTNDILMKLTNRFKNEHEYFSNIRNNKSKTKASSLKNKSTKSKRPDYTNGVSLNEHNKQSANSNRNLIKTKHNIKERYIEDDNTDIVSNSTQVKSLGSIHFYEALDSNSVISIKESIKTIFNKKDRINEIEKKGDVDSTSINYFVQHQDDCSNKVKNIKACDSKKEFLKRFSHMNHLKNVDNCSSVIKNSDSYKSRHRLDTNFEKIVGKNVLFTSNISNKCEISQKKEEISSTKRTSFKFQLSQRSEKKNLDQTQTKLLPTLRHKSQQSVRKETDCRFKETRDPRISRFSGRSKPKSVTSNKELSALSVKYNRFPINNIRT